MIKNKGFPYNVYSILIESCVNSVCDYAGEVTGFTAYESKKRIFLRAARAFLGLPKSSPVAAVTAEIDWLESMYRTQLKMVRQYGRVLRMPNHRLTRLIVEWDQRLSNNVDFSTWSKEINQIFSDNNLLHIYESKQIFNTKLTVDTIRKSMLMQQNFDQSLLCKTFSKLKVYVSVKNFRDKSTFLAKPLSFIQRKNYCKAIMGILPINEEILRYSRPILPAEKNIVIFVL